MSTIRDTGLVHTNDDATDHGEVRVLDADGNPLPAAEVPALSDEQLRALYDHMVLARRFDQRAVSLQRQGRLATYAPMAGQEGAQIAATMALDSDDWVFPTYREHAAKLAAGLDLTDVLAPLLGRSHPPNTGDAVNLMPEYIPIATQLPQATGMAMAMDYCDDDAITLSHFGDGATSEGDFHEALNFAGVFDAPAVFLCHNNQWAISMPRRRQTASATLAQKADAYGFEGIRVDGMDPLAVYSAVAYAREKALDPDDGERRPTLIESVEYRYGAHTTADDPDVYRDEEEVEYWKERDPIDRLESYLVDTGRLDAEDVAAVETWAEETIDEAVDAAESAASPEPDDMFESVYEDLPAPLREQRARLRDARERHGDDRLRRE